VLRSREYVSWADPLVSNFVPRSLMTLCRCVGNPKGPRSGCSTRPDVLLQQFLRENPRFYATPGDWYRGSRGSDRPVLPEPGYHLVEAGKSFVARHATRSPASATLRMVMHMRRGPRVGRRAKRYQSRSVSEARAA